MEDRGVGAPARMLRTTQCSANARLVCEPVTVDDAESPRVEIHEITFDAVNPHGLAQFWASLLERQIRPGDMPADDSVLVLERPGQPASCSCACLRARPLRIGFISICGQQARLVTVRLSAHWSSGRPYWPTGASRTEGAGWSWLIQKGTSFASAAAPLSVGHAAPVRATSDPASGQSTEPAASRSL